jgi:predicted RND superfamily exporter protein
MTRFIFSTIFRRLARAAQRRRPLRHALLVAGRPIAFATLINAGGFLALTFSDLPPMRQFGVVSASAFVLALMADFTALLGALWILHPHREKMNRHGCAQRRARCAPPREARRAPHRYRRPVLAVRELEARLGAQTPLVLKLELFQRTGTFKFRAAMLNVLAPQRGAANTA